MKNKKEFIINRLNNYYENLLKASPYNNEIDNYSFIYSYIEPFLGLAYEFINDYNFKMLEKSAKEKLENNNPKIKVTFWVKPDNEKVILILYKEEEK